MNPIKRHIAKYTFYAIKCPVCGKLTAGRLPRAGWLKGDGTFYFPRRHKVNGKDCPGNIEEGIMLSEKP